MNNKELSDFSWDLVNLINMDQEYIFVSDEKESERLKICKGCEYYNRKEDECEECGCYIPMKVKIIFDSCPINKWGVDKESWDQNFETILKDLKELDNPEESL